MGTTHGYSGYAGSGGTASTQIRPQRQKVQFETNQPVQVQLEDGEGNLQAGAFGDQYRYWLTKHKIMWVEPAVHDAIQATSASPYDCYAITKSESRNGGKRTIAWRVEQIEDEDAEVKQPPAHVAAAMREDDPETATLRKPPATATASREWRERQPFYSTQQDPATMPPPKFDPREPGGQVAPPVPQRPLSAQHAAEARLTECLMSAIRAAAAAEPYARSLALGQIRWTPEDVRAMAISLYISAEKGGR